MRWVKITFIQFLINKTMINCLKINRFNSFDWSVFIFEFRSEPIYYIIDELSYMNMLHTSRYEKKNVLVIRFCSFDLFCFGLHVQRKSSLDSAVACISNHFICYIQNLSAIAFIMIFEKGNTKEMAVAPASENRLHFVW